jgi:hypothetical protein
MSPEVHWPWSVLGLNGPADTKAVRKAYAGVLKTIDQVAEPARFQALRQAYEFAQAVGSPRVMRIPAQALADEVADHAPARTATKPPEPSAPPVPADPEPHLPPTQISGITVQHVDAQALLENLIRSDDKDNANARIRRTLNDPLTSDPNFAIRIELAMRDLVRNSFDAQERPASSAYIDRQTLRALDERFHWLSDFKVFRDRFGLNDALKARLLDRAFGHVTGHPEPDFEAARRKRHHDYLDKIAMFLSVPFGLGTLFFMLLLENLFNIIPDGLLPEKRFGFVAIALAFGAVFPFYLVWRALLRPLDTLVGPRISAAQVRIGLDRLPQPLRIATFFGAGFFALFIIAVVQAKLELGTVGMVPFIAVVMTSLVVINALLFRDAK